MSVRALSFISVAFLLWLQPGMPNLTFAEGQPSLEQQLAELENTDPRLRPAAFNVYIAMQTRGPFVLDTVELKLDGKRLVRHLYTDRESAALAEQAVHRVYSGNLAPGKHELVAEFIGYGKGHRTVTGKYRAQVSPGFEPAHIEMLITDASGGDSPKFEIRKW